MKYNLLEIVQLILSSMDSDEVNSISDTVEAYDIALLVRSVFFDLSTDLNLPEHETLFELTASQDTAKPTLMFLPANVATLKEVKYNVKLPTESFSNYKFIKEVSLNDFISMQNGLRTVSDGTVGSMEVSINGETFEFLYRNNKDPEFYTSVGDGTLIFDSYMITSGDDTLQKSKTLCQGTILPVFILEDTFIPDLDITQFPLLINTAKTRAFSEKKQLQNSESAGHARRQKIIAQKRKRVIKPYLSEVYRVKARYGRK
jgi:hypothetical protein